jgi:hypothetical protein
MLQQRSRKRVKKRKQGKAKCRSKRRNVLVQITLLQTIPVRAVALAMRTFNNRETTIET